MDAGVTGLEGVRGHFRLCGLSGDDSYGYCTARVERFGVCLAWYETIMGEPAHFAAEGLGASDLQLFRKIGAMLAEFGVIFEVLFEAKEPDLEEVVADLGDEERRGKA